MSKINTIQQNSTLSESEGINKLTGLTPVQEKAVFLLVSGKNVTDVSNELKIDRGTLYNWSEKLTFKAHYNKLCSDVQTTIQNSLFGLFNEAIQAIQSSLKSDNEAIKLKTAFWLIEKLENKDIGLCDAKTMIKNICTSESPQFEWGTTTFDDAKYKQLCKENNLQF